MAHGPLVFVSGPIMLFLKKKLFFVFKQNPLFFEMSIFLSLKRQSQLQQTTS